MYVPTSEIQEITLVALAEIQGLGDIYAHGKEVVSEKFPEYSQVLIPASMTQLLLP